MTEDKANAESNSKTPVLVFEKVLAVIHEEHRLVTEDLQRLKDLVSESSSMFRDNFFAISRYVETHPHLDENDEELSAIITKLTQTLQMEDLVSQIINYTCDNIDRLNQQLENSCNSIKSICSSDDNNADLALKELMSKLENSENRLELHPVKQKNMDEGDVDLF